MQLKSYTDLDQSKKLSEILPLESADMYYAYYHNPISGASYYEEYPIFHIPMNKSKSLPCWSLAALLNILPEGTRLLKSTNISSIGDVKYHCNCPKSNIDVWFDNPIDACVDMIEKLHELNLL